MAQYKETVNTEKALNLIAKMLAGKIEQIDFTKIKVSDKDYSLSSVEELQKLEELEEIKQETLVSEKVLLDDNTVNVHGIIYNTDLENSYYLRTIGLYANDPDEGEILYSVTPASHADYVPTPNGNNITTLIIDLKTIIDGATVNLQGNPSALVDVSMLNKKLDKGEGLEEEFDTAVKIVNELKKKQNKEDSTLKTIAKTVVGAINELFSNKLDKGGYTGTAKNLNDEISKKASKTVLGRMIVGDNLTVDDNGRVSGTPAYTHPTGNGNSHIPVNGASGNFLKWLSSGVAQWANITWSDITGKPNSFTPSSHTHTKANITDFPTSMKNPSALTISLNGNSQGAYDGSSAKNIDITPGSINTYTKQEVDSRIDERLPKNGKSVDSAKLNGIANTTGITGNTIVQRDSSADISARLFRSNYQNETRMTGAVAFRVNTSDNYIRFCSDTNAFRNWLGVSARGKADLLWSGGHYMDGGAVLSLNGKNFDQYQMIVIYAACENSDGYSRVDFAGQITCPTAQYGAVSYGWLDLTGNDWCGAYLINNYQIKPSAGSGVWIRRVVGIR